MKWKIILENVVLAGKLSEEVDLKRVHETLKDSTFKENTRFPGVMYRLKNPRATMMMYKNRNIVCTGAPTEALAREAVEKIMETLRREGIVQPTCKYTCDVVNLVGQVVLEDAAINLNRLVELRVAAKSEKFPAPVLKLRDLRVTFLLFPKGKVVCVGADNMAVMNRAVERLLQICKEKGAIE